MSEAVALSGAWHGRREPYRDKRFLDGLVEQVGQSGIAKVCARPAGARRAYQSNLANTLALAPHFRLTVAAQADTSAHLDEIARLVGVGPCT